MQAQAKQYTASEETTLEFKRHILQKSHTFASEPAADLYRIQLLGMMLNRYDELREKGMGEISALNRTKYEFDDIASRMRELGFEETAQTAQTADEAYDDGLSRWPKLSEEEAVRYIHERDAYLHKIAMGSALCSACVAPMMFFSGAAELLNALDAGNMLGLIGMFVMIGMGVYAIVTAAKPRSEKKIRKRQFSLSARLRRMLEQLREEIEDKARKRTGRGVAVIVMSIIPMLVGAMLSEMWYTDVWPLLGTGGMFLMIGAGVYELIMADGEKKSIKRLLKPKEE